VALNLGTACHRQFTELLDGLRQLVVGDLIAQEGDKLVDRRDNVTLGTDAQAIALAETDVWHTDHCCVQDLGMSVQDLFHFAREEPLAAAVDNLLATAGDLHIPVVIDHAAEIADAEPPFAVEGLPIGVRIVVIAEMNLRTARHQFAGLSTSR
jgi:hypothetical protein